MLFIDWSKGEFYLFIFVFLWGALSEAFVIAFGAWKYSIYDFIGIPMWLPFVWGNASIFIKRTFLAIEELIHEKKFKK